MQKEFKDFAAQSKYENPVKAAKRILQVVNAENPPLRILPGNGTTAMLTKIYSRISTWTQWDWAKNDG
jgi:hypothetical protein